FRKMLRQVPTGPATVAARRRPPDAPRRAAEGRCDNRRQRESRILDELPYGITQVLNQRLISGSTPHGGYIMPCRLRVSLPLGHACDASESSGAGERYNHSSGAVSVSRCAQDG